MPNPIPHGPYLQLIPVSGGYELTAFWGSDPATYISFLYAEMEPGVMADFRAEGSGAGRFATTRTIPFGLLCHYRIANMDSHSEILEETQPASTPVLDLLSIQIPINPSSVMVPVISSDSIILAFLNWTKAVMQNSITDAIYYYFDGPKPFHPFAAVSMTPLTPLGIDEIRTDGDGSQNVVTQLEAVVTVRFYGKDQNVFDMAAAMMAAVRQEQFTDILRNVDVAIIDRHPVQDATTWLDTFWERVAVCEFVIRTAGKAVYSGGQISTVLIEGTVGGHPIELEIP